MSIQLILFLFITMWTSAEAIDMDFREYACQVTQESVVTIFKSAAGSTRRVVFMDDYEEILLKSPDTKGLLKWRDVVGIYLEPSNHSKDRNMWIEYVTDSENRSFEVGIVTEKCVGLLRQRYGNRLTFK